MDTEGGIRLIKRIPQKNIIKSSTAPINPIVDDLWIDTSLIPNILKRWDGTVWQEIGTSGNGSISVNDHHASGSNQSTTGTINAGSNQLTLANALDFGDGQGISIYHAGTACSVGQPVNPTAIANGTAGTTTYQYSVVAMDGNGGCSQANYYATVTNGNATLDGTNNNTISWTAPAGTAPTAYAVYGRTGTIGTHQLLAVVTGTSWTDTGKAPISYSTLPSSPPVSALADTLISTISNGAGTTTLTLADNATASATGQVVEHDDTAAIQNAINAANTAGGGTVYFPPGTYLTRPLNLASNVVLLGGSKAYTTLQLKENSTTPLLTGSSISNIRIEHITLDGNKTTGGSGVDSISLTSVTQAIIRNCTIKNGHGHGMEIISCSYVLVEENRIQDNGANGIIFKDTTYLSIVNNDILNSGQRGISNYGTTQIGCLYIRIIDNTISASTLDGILLDYNASNQFLAKYVEIIGNKVINGKLHGMCIRAASSLITGNQVVANGSGGDNQGIVVQANDTNVIGNIVREGTGVGIDMGNCHRCVVDGNLVLSNGCIGIELNATTDSSVTGNVVMYNNATNYGYSNVAGITVHVSSPFTVAANGNCSNNVIANNRIDDGTNQQYGIYIDNNSDHITVSGNIMKSSGNTDDLYSLSSSITEINNITRDFGPDTSAIASAYNLQIGLSTHLLIMSGTTTINTIKFTSNTNPPIGYMITLLTQSALIINNKTTASGNIQLNSGTNITTTANSTITLIWDGSQWNQLGQSIK